MPFKGDGTCGRRLDTQHTLPTTGLTRVNILWVKTELLHPVNRGGRIRTYHMLRALKADHRVTYLALDDGSAAPDALERADEYCHEIERVSFTTTSKESLWLYADLLRNVFSPLPYAIAKYASPALRRRIWTRAASGVHDVLVCDFLSPSQNVPRGLSIPAVLFQHNVEAAIWERHTQVARGWLRRRYFAEQWRRVRRFEHRECHRFDHVIAVSGADADTFRQAYGVTRVSAVPTGVDTAYFAPLASRPRAPHGLVFTGSMDWMPNQDAIEYFASAILPRVQRAVPEATLAVVGRHPTARVERLVRVTPGIDLVGSVPDVRPHMARAAVFVVPIRVGGGTRLKIFEAMEMGLPVVTTTIGAEGLPLRHGEHALFADTPDAFADAVIGLLRSPEEAQALADRGTRYVRTHFSWTTAAQRFAEICADVVARA